MSLCNYSCSTSFMVTVSSRSLISSHLLFLLYVCRPCCSFCCFGNISFFRVCHGISSILFFLY